MTRTAVCAGVVVLCAMATFATSGRVEPIREVLSEELAHNLSKRFEEAKQMQGASEKPTDAAGVPAARKRVSAELGFIGYVEAIYVAISGGAPHAEGGTNQEMEQHTAAEDTVQGC